VLHSHSSGHSFAILTGTITNHNQHITAGVASSRDTNTTVSLEVMASCNLQIEEVIMNVIV
jgi:microcompartment protein CcmL/EutN